MITWKKHQERFYMLLADNMHLVIHVIICQTFPMELRFIYFMGCSSTLQCSPGPSFSSVLSCEVKTADPVREAQNQCRSQRLKWSLSSPLVCIYFYPHTWFTVVSHWSNPDWNMWLPKILHSIGIDMFLFAKNRFIVFFVCWKKRPLTTATTTNNNKTNETNT